MRRHIALTSLVLIFCVPAGYLNFRVQESLTRYHIRPSNPCELQKSCVMIHGASGFAVYTEKGLFLWTAYHVVDDTITEEVEVLPEEGPTFLTHVVRKDIPAVEFVTASGGRGVAEIYYWNQSLDLAVLKVVEGGDGLKGLRFETEIPEVGTRVWFCGNSGSRFGTVTEGVVSYVDRKNDVVKALDQCSAPTFPGASGGVIVRQDTGKVIGLVHGGFGETFTLYVPSRSFKECVEWLSIVTDKRFLVPE